ncbi:uncharacterized protein [Periplaneta americana]|uniref:uncharacterized protein n=1 Tax=Periplaneta americana TaxID=6978 RepID=UPI0037E83441
MNAYAKISHGWMAGNMKPNQHNRGSSKLSSWKKFHNLKPLQPRRKSILEDAVRKIVKKSSRSILLPGKKRISPVQKSPECSKKRKKPEAISKTQLMQESLISDYMETALKLSMHWEKELLQKREIGKGELQNTKTELQKIYYRRKLFPLVENVMTAKDIESSVSHLDNTIPLSKQETWRWAPVLDHSTPSEVPVMESSQVKYKPAVKIENVRREKENKPHILKSHNRNSTITYNAYNELQVSKKIQHSYRVDKPYTFYKYSLKRDPVDVNIKYYPLWL